MNWKRLLATSAIFSAATLTTLAIAQDDASPPIQQPTTKGYPKPSTSPLSWELDGEFSMLKRIVVDVPGSPAPKAYWYLTYVITNNSDQEQIFLPTFEMLTKTGQVLRSNTETSASVFEAVARAENKMPLKAPEEIMGKILIGEDQAKYSAAIWEEFDPEMSSVSIFIAGLSGETAPLRDVDGNEVTTKDADGNEKTILLRKTRQLDFTVRGDDRYAGDPVIQTDDTWIMR
jgi:hypothetical protein